MPGRLSHWLHPRDKAHIDSVDVGYTREAVVQGVVHDPPVGGTPVNTELNSLTFPLAGVWDLEAFVQGTITANSRFSIDLFLTGGGSFSLANIGASPAGERWTKRIRVERGDRLRIATLTALVDADVVAVNLFAIARILESG